MLDITKVNNWIGVLDDDEWTHSAPRCASTTVSFSTPHAMHKLGVTNPHQVAVPPDRRVTA
jgi:hypothetical protein